MDAVLRFCATRIENPVLEIHNLTPLTESNVWEKISLRQNQYIWEMCQQRLAMLSVIFNDFFFVTRNDCSYHLFFFEIRFTVRAYATRKWVLSAYLGSLFSLRWKKKQNLIINFLMVNEPKCSTKQFIKFLICKVEIVKKSPVASNMEINKKKKKMHIQVVSTFYPNQTNSHCDLKFWFGRSYVCCTYHVHLNNLIETKTKTNSFHRIHTCGIERNNFKSAPCIYVYLRTKREVKKTANERR